MKKVIAIALALILIGAAAYAAIDLSGMSFDELMALRQQVDKALWVSGGWTEAAVPTGDYYVGEDIPVGRWTVKCQGDLAIITTYWGDTDESYDCMYWLDTSEPVANINFKDGQRVNISGAVIFRPYTGAALGFK